MHFQKEEKIYKTFIISICLIVAVSFLGVFLVVTIKTRSLIMEEHLSHSRAYFETIVATRLWNANYGGVYVEKKAGIQSNPFILHPDIETKDGRIFTIRNPAIMTREISEFIGKDKDLSFHITSKKLTNPNNKPDNFEQKALDLFETGQREHWEITSINSKRFFRYMAPLYIKKDCLRCHEEQGYKEGDIRGGISVNYNIEDTYRKLNTTTLLIAVFAFITTSLIVTILWFITRRLMRKIAEVRKQIEEMAIKDSLTGISNRRFALDRFEEEFAKAKRKNNPLCCIMLDIDHFKSINDKYGHLIGDDVLREVADRIKKTLRRYEILGRFGGEEFLAILPDTTLEEANKLAYRIQQEINATPIKGSSVTVSQGVTLYLSTDESISDIIKRADDRLYEAKASGRNCIKSSEPIPAE